MEIVLEETGRQQGLLKIMCLVALLSLASSGANFCCVPDSLLLELNFVRV